MLLEEVAVGGGLQVADRVWEQATRTAARVMDRSTSSTWAGPSGPSPAGRAPAARPERPPADVTRVGAVTGAHDVGFDEEEYARIRVIRRGPRHRRVPVLNTIVYASSPASAPTRWSCTRFCVISLTRCRRGAGRVRPPGVTRADLRFRLDRPGSRQGSRRTVHPTPDSESPQRGLGPGSDLEHTFRAAIRTSDDRRRARSGADASIG